MHTLEHIMHKYSEDASKDTMEEITEILSNFIEDMRNHHEKEVEALLHDIKGVVTPYLEEEEAKEFLFRIVNKDGTKGPHWTKAHTDEIARKYGIDLTTGCFNDWDFYAALNITYSDMYEPKFQLEDYVCLTKSFWLKDADWAKHGKHIPGKIKWYLSSKEKYLN